MKPKVIETKICEVSDHLKSALNSGMTSLWVMVVSARSVGWGNNETVTLLYLVLGQALLTFSVKTQNSEHGVSHH